MSERNGSVLQYFSPSEEKQIDIIFQEMFTSVFLAYHFNILVKEFIFELNSC